MNSVDLPNKKRTRLSRACARERIVWAKLAGYKHWPARIIPEHLRASNPDYQQADSYKWKSENALVHFFGRNDLAWVNGKKAVVPWKKGKYLRYHRTKFSSKKNSKQFQVAVDEVRKYARKVPIQLHSKAIRFFSQIFNVNFV